MDTVPLYGQPMSMRDLRDISTQIEAVRRFNRFYTRFLGLFNERLYSADVSLTEARVIWEIKYSRACRATDLIKALGIDRGYLSRILKRMEQAGVVKKATSRKDKRIRTLTLTQKGERLLSNLEIEASEQIDKIFNRLGAREREELVTAMTRIENVLALVNTL